MPRLSRATRVVGCLLMVLPLQGCDNNYRTPFRGLEEARDIVRCMNPDDEGETYICEDGYSRPKDEPRNSTGGSFWNDVGTAIGVLGAIGAGLAIGASGAGYSAPTYRPSYPRGVDGSRSTISGTTR